MVTLKIRSRFPKSNQIFKPSQHYNIWSLARICHLVQEIGCRQAFFRLKFENFSAGVTLKMRSRSPKFNHFFPPFHNVSVQDWSKSTDWFRRYSAANEQRGRRRDPHQKQYVPTPILLVLVWFLFYGPSTHFRSFRARSVTLTTLFLGKPPRQFTST